MGQTFTARQTARDVQAALAKAGVQRDVDAKRVRAWVRDNVDAYDDDGYTAHVYDARTHATIVAALVKRYTGGTGTNGRASAASTGRAKVPTTTAPKRKRGTGSVKAAPMAADVESAPDA